MYLNTSPTKQVLILLTKYPCVVNIINALINKMNKMILINIMVSLLGERSLILVNWKGNVTNKRSNYLSEYPEMLSATSGK